MMFGHGSFGWIGMLIGLLIVFAVIIGFGWLAVSLIQRADQHNKQPKTQVQFEQNPREIAAMRYAKGELSREEFQQITSDLTS